MPHHNISVINTAEHQISSTHVLREVTITCYIPASYNPGDPVKMLLINDGQDLVTMGFEQMLDELIQAEKVEPLFCVGIHCAPDRKNEYGTAAVADYKGRGAKASLFTKFIFLELLPYLRTTYGIEHIIEKAYAGFSLGGLCALDIAWAHPHEFTRVGVFSGSLWWRDKDQADEDFDEQQHRIMHRLIREGNYASWLKFFFEVGTQDETADRNKNGIIDSIDDTLDLIRELEQKGYNRDEDIFYLELQDGRHDVATWAMALPVFLTWGWGK